jgi:hypothetical protein
MKLEVWIAHWCSVVPFWESFVDVVFLMSYRRHDTVLQPYQKYAFPSCLPRRDWDDNIETNEKDADTERTRMTICSICLESFVLGDQVTQFLCAHPLHFECARQWFIWCLIQNHAGKCPVCNTIVVAARSSCQAEYDSMGILRTNFVRDVAPVIRETPLNRIKKRLLLRLRRIIRFFGTWLAVVVVHTMEQSAMWLFRNHTDSSADIKTEFRRCRSLCGNSQSLDWTCTLYGGFWNIAGLIIQRWLCAYLFVLLMFDGQS